MKLDRISAWHVRQERRAAGTLAFIIMTLIVVNVVTRFMNRALFWIDEVAVFLMIWMLFLATAVLLKDRKAVAVTVLVDLLPGSLRQVVGVLVDWVVLTFGVLLLVLCWRWYQPLALWQAGFDVETFSEATMNFIYQDMASTLPLARFWVWLVVPYFSCSIILHSLANILSDPTGRYMNHAGGESS